MRYIRAAAFFCLAIAGILFGISNQDTASVHVYWYFTKSYPLYLVLFACFLAGTVAAIVYGYISGTGIDDTERRLNKRLADIEGKVAQAKAVAAKASSTPPEGIDGSRGSTS